MKQKLLFLLTALMLLTTGNAWADRVYFNDFNTGSGTTAPDGLTIHGDGSFVDEGDSKFGMVFQNGGGAQRTHYLQLPADALSHSASSKKMTIGFWVNKGNAGASDTYLWAPLFTAYGNAPSNNTNTWPMLACQYRGVLQVNNAGWCDYVDIQNVNGVNTLYHGDTDWLADAGWHYYTVVFDNEIASVYFDGVLKNQWNVAKDYWKLKVDPWTIVDTEPADPSNYDHCVTTQAGLYSNGGDLNYVCLGGNQAWSYADNDAAFKFDDFAVYDEALSAAQIEKIMDAKYGYTSVTYDFTSYNARTLANSGTQGHSGVVNCNYASNLPEVYNRFAFQFADAENLPQITNEGLYFPRSKGDHAAVLGLQTTDILKINYTAGTIMVRGAVPDYSAVTTDWTEYTTGAQINMAADVNFLFQAKTLCKISSIVIKTTATETMTAPAISSEASGSARTVTITEGASSLLSGVSTYYTTDGSVPTASSTKYTAPFDITETTTIKAITISNSSAETASDVTEELIDMDAVDVPTAAITAVDGVNRTVSFACATEGAAIYYSTDNGENYTEGTSLVISENTYIKVKATKGLATAESENTLFEAGTAIKLNNPSYSIGAYSEGKYTLTLTSEQTDKLLSPVAVVKYTVNDGETQTINSGETVEATVGSTYKFWSNAAGYDNSDEVVVTPTYIDLSTYRTDWSMDLDALAMAMTGTNTSKSVTKSAEELVSGYYNVTDDGFNAKFGVNNVNWQVRNYGSGKSYNTGLWPYNVSGSMVITELSAGDVIVFTGDAVTAGTNVTKDVFVSTANNNSTFVVTADGNATFTPTMSGYIHSLAVYTLRPTSVSVTIGEAGYSTFGSPYPLDLTPENLADGVKAYKATSVKGETIQFVALEQSVPANTGILIAGEPGEITIPVATSSTPVEGENLLKVNASGEKFDAEVGCSYYGLLKDTKEFHPFAPGTVAIPANKAYLRVENINSARLIISFDDEEDPTGINVIETAEAKAEGLKDGKYLIGNKVVLVKNGVKYGANGQKLN